MPLTSLTPQPHAPHAPRVSRVLLLLLALLLIGPAGFSPLFAASARTFVRDRRVCVSRDADTLPGYVITTWHKGGKLDCVITNRLHAIEGKEQHNPLQDLAERLRKSAEEWQAAAEMWRASATNNAARAERVTAALDEKRAEYVEKRDKAALPSTKALYQAFIDAIDRIKERLAIESE